VAALSLVSAVAVAPVMAAPPVDEVETALFEIVDTLGIMLPMEEAILYALNIMQMTKYEQGNRPICAL
jgi:hypothetical protein